MIRDGDCWLCQGTGALAMGQGRPEKHCPRCGGTGKVVKGGPWARFRVFREQYNRCRVKFGFDFTHAVKHAFWAATR